LAASPEIFDRKPGANNVRFDFCESTTKIIMLGLV
jgi:hypothetical protein